MTKLNSKIEPKLSKFRSKEEYKNCAIGAIHRDFGVVNSFNIKSKRNGYQITHIRPNKIHGPKAFDKARFLKIGKDLIHSLANYFSIRVE